MHLREKQEQSTSSQMKVSILWRCCKHTHTLLSSSLINSSSELRRRTFSQFWDKIVHWPFLVFFFVVHRFAAAAVALFLKDPNRVQNWPIIVSPRDHQSPKIVCQFRTRVDSLFLLMMHIFSKPITSFTFWSGLPLRLSCNKQLKSSRWLSSSHSKLINLSCQEMIGHPNLTFLVCSPPLPSSPPFVPFRLNWISCFTTCLQHASYYSSLSTFSFRKLVEWMTPLLLLLDLGANKTQQLKKLS